MHHRLALGLALVGLLTLTAGCAGITIDQDSGPETITDVATTNTATNDSAEQAVTVRATSTTNVGPTDTPTRHPTDTPTRHPTDTPTATRSPTTTPTFSPTPTVTPTPPPTLTPTPTPPQNPWRSAPVGIYINTTAAPDPDRNYTTLVRSATRYWLAKQNQYADYTVTWTILPWNLNPDLEIRFVPDLSTCGRVHDPSTVGCAPVLNKTHRVNRTTVYIEARLNDTSAIETLKHEFGHIYGLTHGESPSPLMSATYKATLVPRLNATERDWPWRNKTLTYYVQDSINDSGINQSFLTQVNETIDYYNCENLDIVPHDAWIIPTRNPNAADLVLTRELISSRGLSLRNVTGQDFDDDEAYEYFTSYEIVLSRLPVNRTGWHMGYWLANAFGATNDSERPEPFNKSEDEPRENWWTHYDGHCTT